MAKPKGIQPAVTTEVHKVGELIPDNRNANKGTQRGDAALEFSLRKYGAGRSILIDKNGRIIAGNKTAENAGQIGLEDVIVVPSDGKKLIAVQRVDLDIDSPEARALAIADNRVGELNLDWDMDVLNELATETDLSQLFTQNELDELNDLDIAETEAADEEAEEEWQPEEFSGIKDFVEDAVFPSTHPWGIPDLREDMLADEDCYATSTWAGQAFNAEQAKRMMFAYGSNAFPAHAKGGILSFYVDDDRFEVVWNNAVEIVRRFVDFGWRAICSPDFSLWRADPKAIQIYNLYRSRWVARYWQEAGLKIIPSLVGYDEETCEWGARGIPNGCPIVAAQCRTGVMDIKNRKNVTNKLAMNLEIIKPKSCILYGGDIHREWIEPCLPGGITYHWLEAWANARQKVRQGKRN